MKHKFKYLILVLGLAGCREATSFNPFDYSNVKFNVPQIEYPTEMFGRTLEGYDRMLMYVARNFGYSSDLTEHGVLDKWENPEEFWNRRRGDCEEFVIMDLYLLKRDFGIKGKMVLGINKINGKGHGWLEIDGKYYEGQYGVEQSFSNYTIVYKLSYEEVMKRVSDYPKGLEGFVVDED